MPFPQNPYPIFGIIQGGIANITITGLNLNTGEIEQIITADDGSYIIDPANMTNGYSNGDVIRISAGTWYFDIVIDTDEYPGGVEKNLNKPVVIKTKKIHGASIERGVVCGRGS